MSQSRFDRPLVLDDEAIARLEARRYRKRVETLVRRMKWLKKRAEGHEGARRAGDVREYTALHWILERIGMIKPEGRS